MNFGTKKQPKVLFSSEGSYLLLWWPTKSKSATLFDNQDGTKVVFVAPALKCCNTPNAQFLFFLREVGPKKVEKLKEIFFFA